MTDKVEISNFPFIELDHLDGPYWTYRFEADLWTKTSSWSPMELTRVGAEIAYWCACHEPVRHSNTGDRMFIENDYERPSNRHTLYFVSQFERDEFHKFFNSKELMEDLDDQLFPCLEHMDIEDFQARGVTIMMAPVDDLGSITQALKFWMWARDNCVGEIWRLDRAGDGGDLMVFEKAEDFALYKLKFQGNNEVDVKAA